MAIQYMFVHILSNMPKSNDFTISMDIALLTRHLQSVIFKSAMKQDFSNLIRIA